jgi:hypothetical protein
MEKGAKEITDESLWQSLSLRRLKTIRGNQQHEVKRRLDRHERIQTTAIDVLFHRRNGQKRKNLVSFLVDNS